MKISEVIMTDQAEGRLIEFSGGAAEEAEDEFSDLRNALDKYDRAVSTLQYHQSCYQRQLDGKVRTELLDNRPDWAERALAQITQAAEEVKKARAGVYAVLGCNSSLGVGLRRLMLA